MIEIRLGSSFEKFNFFKDKDANIVAKGSGNNFLISYINWTYCYDL